MSELRPAVLLGGEGSSLSVMRSLSRAGVFVHVLGGASSLARHSRLCGAFHEIAPGEGVQERWLEWLENGPAGAVVLPCSDDGLELVARNRPRLVELGYVPIEANDEALLAMLDKDRTYSLARAMGVAAPAVATVRSTEDLERAIASLSYPCVLKPLQSHVWARHFYGKVVVVADEDELRATFARMLGLGIEMMVTEVVPGRDDQYFSYYTYLDEHGEPLFHFTKRKLRQHPPGFGTGTYHISDRDAEVAELGLRFFQRAGLRGLVNVEFKRDSTDGELKLIECNHRFTAANELVRLAGLDLALFTYNRLQGRPGPALDSYRTGVRMWFAVEDTRALAAYRRRGQLSTLQWALSMAHPQHFPVFKWDDPKPSAVAASRLAARARDKLVRPRRPARGDRRSPIADKL